VVYVVSGAIQLTVAGIPHKLQAGESILVAGGVEHQASSEQAAEVLDIFAPYREEYAAHSVHFFIVPKRLLEEKEP